MGLSATAVYTCFLVVEETDVKAMSVYSTVPMFKHVSIAGTTHALRLAEKAYCTPMGTPDRPLTCHLITRWKIDCEWQEKKWRSYKSKQLFSELGHQSKWKSPHGRRSLRAEEITREQSPEEARPGGSEEQEGDDEFPKYSSDEISVHMRMFARPNNELDW